MKNFVVQKIDGTVLGLIKSKSIETALLNYCHKITIKTDSIHIVNSTFIEFTHCCVSYTLKEVENLIEL